MSKLNPKHIEVIPYRSKRCGGFVNVSDDAVKIRHKPSGLSVRCSYHKTIHQNRAVAEQFLIGILKKSEKYVDSIID